MRRKKQILNLNIWTYKPVDNSANRTDFTVEQVTIM